ncbi:MAG: glycosyltransferase, partial [Bacilli bacterium]
MKKCDIIIPVYNAYDSLIQCIKTIINNTDLTENSLIIINDKSSDKRIDPFLKELVKEYENLNIQILTNSENLGFVKTVNKGMMVSKNDVLLLNSDTEVPENWLDDIKKCAYSAPNIATVTPLSNNATLSSVPFAFQKNEIPDKLSFQEYADIVKKCSYQSLIELPTAHGFCMYIKREILNKIGYFDETFGKGYGEENDFSFRALDYGYRNVLCDNVIVLHKESQSFSNSKNKLIEEHNKILRVKHPFYINKLEDWCLNNPIEYIGKNIIYNLELKNKPNILVIIHDFDSLVGGTTLHVKDIINSLKTEFNFHVLGYSEGSYKLYSCFENHECVTTLKSISKTAVLPIYNAEYKEMVSNIVEILGISYIHIHHMMNHYFDLIDIKKKYNLKMIITLHDFYCVCPTINMIYNGNYCENVCDKDCSSCLKKEINLNCNILDSWHNNFKRLFLATDLIIVPSEDTKEKISKVYSDID